MKPGCVPLSDLLGLVVNRALFGDECQRLAEWARIGPVQRAALESFAERLLAEERERWKRPAFLWSAAMPDEVARWFSAHPPEVVPRDEMQRVDWPNNQHEARRNAVALDAPVGREES